MDDFDWEMHCREVHDALLSLGSRPLPADLWVDHQRLFAARMRAQRDGLKKLMAANPNIDWRF